MTRSQPCRLRLSIFYTQSPIGLIVVFEDDAGFVRALNFQDRVDNAIQLLGRYFGEIELREGRGRPSSLDHLDAYFAGKLQALRKIPVTLAGTEFQRSVWSALLRIRPGTAVSYADVANMIGRPGTARAVGAAIAGNPIALVVPCHRVIGSDLTLTGYGPGLHRKRWLFAHEMAHRHSSPSENVQDLEPRLEASPKRAAARVSGGLLSVLGRLFHPRGLKLVAHGVRGR
jgi:methylated-DNA-[protein]-cysteine S-methyltransferase